MKSSLPEHQVALPPFRPGRRSSGVLVHVTSLPSPYGIGDLGPAAFEWVDRLHDAGQRWWQALPLGPTGCGNSPYSSLSSFAGNALLVSPDLLIEDGLLSTRDCEPGRRLPKSAVDFDAVIAFKHRLLDQARRNFDSSARPELQAALKRFCSEEEHSPRIVAQFLTSRLSFLAVQGDPLLSHESRCRH
jgi:4-alpha-glucanotransferase